MTGDLDLFQRSGAPSNSQQGIKTTTSQQSMDFKVPLWGKWASLPQKLIDTLINNIAARCRKSRFCCKGGAGGCRRLQVVAGGCRRLQAVDGSAGGCRRMQVVDGSGVLLNEKGLKQPQTFAEELWGNCEETFNSYVSSLEANEIADCFYNNLFENEHFLLLKPVHYVTQEFLKNLRLDIILREVRDMLYSPDCFEYYEDFV
ncbi:hypothetical protein TNCV_2067291 [Trichonephila clavipes]|uniref:Uncharacterized protein n=1 Tax=Trichonephila clavipes TaxID=2585209 RepID=A0A8X7BD61_TRICX|nr:hypothetical protein TNCV_2067291 [Trichonephila clavipes]